jgi:hypothetical protein
MWDLNDVAPSTFNLVQASGISDRGVIAGTANRNCNADSTGATAFIALPKD